MSSAEVRRPSACRVRGAYLKWLQPFESMIQGLLYLQYLATITAPCSFFMSLACRVRNMVHSTHVRHMLTGGACCSCGPAGSGACKPGGAHR